MGLRLDAFEAEMSKEKLAQLRAEQEKKTWKDSVGELFDPNEYVVSLTAMRTPVTNGRIKDLIRTQKSVFEKEFDMSDEDAIMAAVWDHIKNNQEMLLGKGQKIKGFKNLDDEAFKQYMAASDANDKDMAEEKRMRDAGNETQGRTSIESDNTSDVTVDQENDAPGGNPGSGSTSGSDASDKETGAADGKESGHGQRKAMSEWETWYKNGNISASEYRRAEMLQSLSSIIVSGQGTFSALTDPNNYLHSSNLSLAGRRAAKRLAKANREYMQVSSLVSSEYTSMLSMAHRRSRSGQRVGDEPDAQQDDGHGKPMTSGLFGGLRDRFSSLGRGGKEEKVNDKATENGHGRAFTMFVSAGGRIAHAFTSAREATAKLGNKLKSNGTVLGLATGSALFALAHPLRTIRDTGHNIRVAINDAVERNKNGQEKTAEWNKTVFQGIVRGDSGVSTEINKDFAVGFMTAMITAIQNDPDFAKRIQEALGKYADMQASTGHGESQQAEDTGKQSEGTGDCEADSGEAPTEPEGQTGKQSEDTGDRETDRQTGNTGEQPEGTGDRDANSGEAPTEPEANGADLSATGDRGDREDDDGGFGAAMGDGYDEYDEYGGYGDDYMFYESAAGGSGDEPPTEEPGNDGRQAGDEPPTETPGDKPSTEAGAGAPGNGGEQHSDEPPTEGPGNGGDQFGDEPPTERPTEQPGDEPPTEQPGDKPPTEPPTEQPGDEPPTDVPGDKPSTEVGTGAPGADGRSMTTVEEIFGTDDPEAGTQDQHNAANAGSEAQAGEGSGAVLDSKTEQQQRESVQIQGQEFTKTVQNLFAKNKQADEAEEQKNAEAKAAAETGKDGKQKSATEHLVNALGE